MNEVLERLQEKLREQTKLVDLLRMWGEIGNRSIYF